MTQKTTGNTSHPSDNSMPMGCLLACGVILMALIALTGLSCRHSGKTQTVAEQAKGERIDNIVRVMMHKPSKFTLYTSAPGSTKLTPRMYDVGLPVEVYMDVPPGEPMWARYFYAWRDDRLEVHIHDPKDINGGEHSSGHKNRTKTQTEPLE
jgi:hypothetical protein